MLCIINGNLDPTFNLAAEEYLLNRVREPTFMVWRNRSAVIIGRNQNPHRQANTLFLHQNRVPVLRRISGGGAVYHDPGNINFTFLCPTGGKLVVDYSTPLQPIRRFLKRLGIDAEFDGANGLTVHGKKISGNAQHIHKGMVLHHGTLLYETDLVMLARALKPTSRGQYHDRSVDSVRQPVVNLKPMVGQDLAMDDFMEQLLRGVQYEKGGRRVQLSEADRWEIEKLAESKYRTWHWNSGQTPDYRFTGTFRLGGKTIEIDLRVRAGIICQIGFNGHGLSPDLIKELQRRLVGCGHTRREVSVALQQIGPPFFLEVDGIAVLTDALF